MRQNLRVCLTRLMILGLTGAALIGIASPARAGDARFMSAFALSRPTQPQTQVIEFYGPDRNEIRVQPARLKLYRRGEIQG